MTTLEDLIKRLDSNWRTVDDFDKHIARLMNVPEYDTLSGQTHRAGLDAFGVLERDGTGRLRKRVGYTVPSKIDFEAAENRKLREIQRLEQEHFAAVDKRREEERSAVWQAEEARIVGVIDKRLRELGLLSDTPAADAGKGGQ